MEMSITKRWMEQEEHKLNVATEIAIQAGVLERCEFCESIVYQTGENVEEAYKLGNTQFSRGELEAFDSRKEMTDAVKATVENPDHASDCCHHCDEMMNGDD
tara:strand:+ start:3602 stop:3907 length:306 start_codon:yes stop_codon:yes gene_type:complete